jgi:nitroreductase/NAD-dependent dihydropyrimidine dehydrogenase PreA subunit
MILKMLFTVDKEKCKKDGICASECPRKIILIDDVDKTPYPAPDAEEQCNHCGHCVAVCPTGAINHSSMSPDECPPVQDDLLLNIEQAEQFLRSRRSIRSYLGKQPEQEKLAKLIDMAHYSPTGTNSQLIKWTVINSRERVYDIAGLVVDFMQKLVEDGNPAATRFNAPTIIEAWESNIDTITRGAPALVFTHAPQNYSIGYIDCTSALAYLDLAAPTLGLGTCWAGFVLLALGQMEVLRLEIPVPDGHVCHGAMMVGYPKYRYHRLPKRNPANIDWS